MERESPREEALRKLAEGRAKLQELKDNKEFFDVSLEMVNWLLDDLEDSLAPNECEESYKESGRVLEWLHGYIKDALDLAIPFTTPEGEQALRQALDKVSNLRIRVWQYQKAAEHERVSLRVAMGDPACPAMIYAGVARTSDDMASERAIAYCLGECPYQDRCESPIPHPKP